MKIRKSVLIATGSEQTAAAVQECLGHRFDVMVANAEKDCFELFQRKRHEFVFLDIDLISAGIPSHSNDNPYINILAPYLQIFPTTEIIIISPQESIRKAVNAVKAGAGNYVTSPIDIEEVRLVTKKIQDDIITQEELDYLRDQFWDTDFLEIVKTNSPKMKEVLKKIRSVAPTKTTVLLLGETGTGKGVMARLIHAHSNRKGNQFIGVHCGAIPDTLIESELFGHEKGAFTGAVKRKLGKFEIAKEGTIFLDEINTITSSTQIKLLQVLQDRTFQPVGGEVNIETDARFIAASNCDLQEMAESGEFRKDLYYRLNVFPIELPPLRDRKEDIPELVSQFIRQLNLFHAKQISGVHPVVLEALHAYEWPGNIRELENLIERAHILETSSTLTPESFPMEFFQNQPQIAQVNLSASKTLAEVRRAGIESIERQYLKEILSINKGRIAPSARDADISTRQLHKLLTKYGIKKVEFK
ncbi:MAG: sigma-54-dependent Fis family transcriptional regulator [Pseudomonadota bacterium]